MTGYVVNDARCLELYRSLQEEHASKPKEASYGYVIAAVLLARSRNWADDLALGALRARLAGKAYPWLRMAASALSVEPAVAAPGVPVAVTTPAVAPRPLGEGLWLVNGEVCELLAVSPELEAQQRLEGAPAGRRAFYRVPVLG